MKRILQMMSGAAMGVFVAVSGFVWVLMVATYILFWTDMDVHPMTIAVPAAVFGLAVVIFCIRLREHLLRLSGVEAWAQRVVIALAVLPVLGCLTLWFGGDWPF